VTKNVSFRLSTFDFRLQAAALAMALFCSLASAQPYPGARAVRIIVPFSPGSGIDTLARDVAARLADRWNASVIVDNRAGASANIGHELAAAATPDGHTLLLTAATFVTNAAVNRSQRYDPVRNFAPVVLIATGIQSLTVPASSPAKTTRELIARAKEQPGKLHYGSPGIGTPHHLVMEQFKLEAGVDIVHVPYKGFAGAIVDFIAGRVDMMVMPVSAVAPHVQGGRARVLAVMAPERSPVFPAVPTLAQEGYPNVQASNWYALLAPAGTPVSIVERLNREVNTLLGDAGIREALVKQGFNPSGGAPGVLSRQLREEQQRWQRIVEQARIRAE
jgi:tripartite-type tricarboxylate transporter receptor subunit TctC